MADFDPDSFADKLLAAIKRDRRPSADEDDDFDPRDEARGRVPYTRFQAKAAEVKALRDRLAELEADFVKYRTAKDDQIKALSDAQAKAIKDAKDVAAADVTRIAQGHAEDLDLVDAGLRDALGRKAARDAYSMLAEKDRPATVVDFVRNITNGIKARAEYLADAKADPEKAPAMPQIPPTMVGYFKQEPPAAPPAKPGARPPNVDTGVRSGPRKTALDMVPDKDTSFADFFAALRAEEQASQG